MDNERALEDFNYGVGLQLRRGGCLFEKKTVETIRASLSNEHGGEVDIEELEKLEAAIIDDVRSWSFNDVKADTVEHVFEFLENNGYKITKDKENAI